MCTDSESVLEESALEICQTCKDTTGRTGPSKPCAADYDEATQKLIELAIAEFQVRVSTQYAYPEDHHNDLTTWVEECWANACNHQRSSMKLMGSLKRLVSLLTSLLPFDDTTII